MSTNQDKLQELQNILRKKPQIGRPVTKIPLLNKEKYADLWFDNQEDLDAFDSLMRKKIFYQSSYGPNGEKEFIFNGVKTTFGIFSKEISEKVFQDSCLLKKQKAFVSFFLYKIKK
jgi:hypothetical protein